MTRQGSSRFAIVVLLVCGLAVGGIAVARLFNVATESHESPPEIRPEQVVTVRVPYPNAAAVEVQEHVTVPIQNALEALPGLLAYDSISSEGMCEITLRLDGDCDLVAAVEEISHRIDGLSDLPEFVEDPIVASEASNAIAELYLIVERNYDQGITDESDLDSTIDVSTLERFVEQLHELKFVQDVAIIGDTEVGFSIHADPDRLRQYELTLTDVSHALRNEVLELEGGSVDETGEIVLLRTTSPDSVESLEDVVIGLAGDQSIRIRDIGLVELEKKHDEIVRLDGRPAAAIRIKANVNQLDEITQALDEILGRWNEESADLRWTMIGAQKFGSENVLIETQSPIGTPEELFSEVLFSLEESIGQSNDSSTILTIASKTNAKVWVFQTDNEAAREWKEALPLREPPGIECRVIELPPGQLDVLRNDIWLTGPVPELLIAWTDAVRESALVDERIQDIMVHLPFETRPEIRIDLDHEKLAIYGLTAEDVASFIRLSYGSLDLNGITLDYGRTSFIDPTSIEDMTVRTPTGALIPLSEVAPIEVVIAQDRLMQRNGHPAAKITLLLAPEVEPQGIDEIHALFLQTVQDARGELDLDSTFHVE